MSFLKVTFPDKRLLHEAIPFSTFQLRIEDLLDKKFSITRKVTNNNSPEWLSSIFSALFNLKICLEKISSSRVGSVLDRKLSTNAYKGYRSS